LGFRNADFGFELSAFEPAAKIYNPQSETGNPPAGWEFEGQIRNVERVFFLGYFEDATASAFPVATRLELVDKSCCRELQKKSLGTKLGESKTS
jgi:hypothetical protein